MFLRLIIYAYLQMDQKDSLFKNSSKIPPLAYDSIYLNLQELATL